MTRPEPWPNDDLTRLANQYLSDKGTHFQCAHGYTRVYQSLLEPYRETPLCLAEIGLVHGRTQAEGAEKVTQRGCASLRMWADYLPLARIHGLDIVDFTTFTSERVVVTQGDQGNRADLARFVRSAAEPFDIVVDDGSHASHHQQISLGALFPALAEGGLYIIEDLHFQPEEMELADVSKTRDFLYSLLSGRTGLRLALDQQEYQYLLAHIASIHFFDSISPRWPLNATADAIAVIRKRGQHRFFAKDTASSP